jgi:hypothetical protein
MTKRFAATSFGYSGSVVAVLVAVLAIGLVADVLTAQNASAQNPAAGQRGPAAPPSPCGPKSMLPPELSTNVAPDSRCFEIRMYTVDPSRDGVGQFKGGINELHQRFREKEVEIFQKHGAQILGVWQHLGDPLTRVWMIAYKDRDHREKVWAAFNADPEWDSLRRKYFVPLKANTFLMSASDYSPMK